MIVIPSLLPVLLLLAETDAGNDFIRFENGDSVHGEYLGLDEGPLLRWQNPESPEPTAYEVGKLRKLLLNGGKARDVLQSAGTVTLANGDSLAGRIISVGEDSVSLQTEFAGLLTIPRNTVASLSPNFPGGPPIYAGPFTDDHWTILPEPGEEEEAEDDASDEDANEAPWALSGGSWYSNSTRPLCLDAKLQDEVSIRFRVEWRNQLNLFVAFYADFEKPARAIPAEEEEDPAEEEAVNLLRNGGGGDYPNTYGSSYLLALQQSYTRLRRTFFDEDGEAQTTTYRNTSSNFRFNNLEEAIVELRVNRQEGLLRLYVDGEPVGEWDELKDEFGHGDYLAFAPMSNSQVRISDIVVSPWNGMPDSARSMSSGDRDVVLLTNGTDRLSGKVLTLEEEVFRLETDYTTFQIPASDVESIHFATDNLAESDESEAGEDFAMINFRPRGRLTLLPHSGQGDILTGTHPVLGDLRVDLDFAYLIEFDPEATIFDNWDDNF